MILGGLPGAAQGGIETTEVVVAVELGAHTGPVTQGDVSIIGAQGQRQGNRVVEIQSRSNVSTQRFGFGVDQSRCIVNKSAGAEPGSHARERIDLREFQDRTKI